MKNEIREVLDGPSKHVHLSCESCLETSERLAEKELERDDLKLAQNLMPGEQMTTSASQSLESALADALAATGFPLGVSPNDFESWYRSWWPEGQQAKPGTSLVLEWFADAEAQVQDGTPLTDNSHVVLALIAEMPRPTEAG